MTPLVRPVLEHLRASVQHLRRFPAADLASQVLFSTLEKSLRRLIAEIGDTVHFTMHGTTLYLGEEPMLHESLEFSDLGRQVAARGIESISIAPSVTKVDVVALTQFIAGTSPSPPEERNVWINQNPVTLKAAPEGLKGTELRTAYLVAMETLKAAVFASRTGEIFDMDSVRTAVDGLITASRGRPTATVLLSTMRNKAEYFFYHSVNTTLLALEMGRVAGMRIGDLRVLGIGALLHDLGKGLVVPEAIDDPGRLGPEQWRQMRKYPSRSALAILEAATPGTEAAAVIAYEHNIRHDLGGYPEMPDGHVQHPAAALLSVVDVYDAVTSRRAYRRAETNGNAVQILIDGAGSQFHPGMVRLFVERFGTIPPGSCFRLMGGEVLIAAGALGGGQGIRGLIVEDRNGNVVAAPRPVVVPLDQIAGELSVVEAKTRPAAYLDHIEEVERRTSGAPVR